VRVMFVLLGLYIIIIVIIVVVVVVVFIVSLWGANST
jgi:hypothetical protein